MATPKKEKDTVTIENIPRGADQIGGSIEMSADVVAMIAGMAAREVEGIHKLGKSSLIGLGKNDPSKGVGAEVGETEAALDLELTINYGADIRKVAGELRRRIAEQVDRMAGRKVIEVNIKVLGIHFPEDDKPEETASEERRVR
jgi:uncharacterized alkaline shock family protein YloU